MRISLRHGERRYVEAQLYHATMQGRVESRRYLRSQLYYGYQQLASHDGHGGDTRRQTVGQVSEELGGYKGHEEGHVGGQREGARQMEDRGHAPALQIQLSGTQRRRAGQQSACLIRHTFVQILLLLTAGLRKI